MKKLAVLIATWFGSGLIPPPKFMHGIAGTYGSFFALPLCLLFVWLPTLPFWLYQDTVVAYIYLVIIITALGLWSVQRAEWALGPRTDWKGKTKFRDQNQIVIDEVLGMLVTCAPLILALQVQNWRLAYLIAFLLFRFFGIVKVPPTKKWDRRQDAIGVMMDDVVAGVYAAILLTITVLIFKI